MRSESFSSKDHNPSEEPGLSQERHPAFSEKMQARMDMVAQQIAGRGVRDPRVLRAMETVPRHVFVPQTMRSRAYEDGPLPIGANQTISQPYIVAFMTEALHLNAHSTVLEIGTGSGYQAAVCAEIARQVYSIEIVEALAVSARQRLEALGYHNVLIKAGDGFYGWPEVAPFDAIIGTAAAGHIPPPLVEQLKIGGRMIIPEGQRDGVQTLMLIAKDLQGHIQRQESLSVRFVPMTGDVEK